MGMVMASLREFAHAIWNFGLFVPLFCILFVIGGIKALLTGPLATAIILLGDVAVVIGLWPPFVFWTYRSTAMTKKLGLSLKLLLLISLPVPLIIWPVVVFIGSLLVGFGYGFFTPLIATFEAVGEGREQKLYNCFMDGMLGTIKGSCTVVRDFTDWCYHSYPAYLDDFRHELPKDGKPYNIKILEVPRCVLVGLLGLLIDVPIIGLLALLKSPLMLIKGWGKLLKNFITTHGTCTKAVCVPFAGISIILWPLVVVSGFLCALMSSFLLGLYGAVVVYQESSFRSGLAYIVAIVAEFDEYTNDVLDLQEGSCLPRPVYRKHVVSSETPQKTVAGNEILAGKGSTAVQICENQQGVSFTQRTRSISRGEGTIFSQLTASKSLRHTIQEVKVVHIWDHMFKTLDIYGKALIEAGVIKATDLEDVFSRVHSDKSRLVGLGLPAYALLHNLLHSSKYNSPGLILHDGLEVNNSNRPHDGVLDWFFDPLVVLKEQIKAANLQEAEVHYLEKLALTNGHPEQLDFWQSGAFPPEDNLKRAELQAIARRIQGIATSITRLPTYRRQFQQFVRSLLMYAQKKSGSQVTHVDGSKVIEGMPSYSNSFPSETVSSRIGDDVV
ncbi:hypothetical protein O6H91_02G072700 [Diphasiastrum complanatum]|uniref:Uncharacterized protein n=1 Tax=Diphasiastrum complanatum TaxID=34168 RepID=A0ACC2EH64_DIPCM|nr:hypothetical protein O6H91_02G072700 [Diphasiastrum complanatum]